MRFKKSFFIFFALLVFVVHRASTDSIMNDSGQVVAVEAGKNSKDSIHFELERRRVLRKEKHEEIKNKMNTALEEFKTEKSKMETYLYIVGVVSLLLLVMASVYFYKRK